MRVHRSAHTHFFTTLGNDVLRDSRLSFCARGILAHLLSQPDGERHDIRMLTDRTPEGRERVASAMRELERFGYLKRTKLRTPEGRIFTVVDVFDAPQGSSSQVEPHDGCPASGEADAEPDGDQTIKKRDEETTHPAPPARRADDKRPDDERADEGRAGDGDRETNASAELLARVARAEPKLSLGRIEALRLAPLVTEWRRRGASDLHIINSLTAGLPRSGVHHPARFLETRLTSKMPAQRRAAPQRLECDECGVPVLAPGRCGPCDGLRTARARAAADFAQVRARGAALARAALRGLSVDSVLPAAA